LEDDCRFASQPSACLLSERRQIPTGGAASMLAATLSFAVRS
jgi:hypothetical protein